MAGLKAGRIPPDELMVPGGRELDLKKLAASLGEKKLKMATQKEAEALTGLLTGGISALALINKGFDICLERAAEKLDYMHVSAGQRGANIRLQPRDLVAVTGCRLVDTQPD